MGFEAAVWCLGFGIWRVGVRVSSFRFQVSGFGIRIRALDARPRLSRGCRVTCVAHTHTHTQRTWPGRVARAEMKAAMLSVVPPTTLAGSCAGVRVQNPYFRMQSSSIVVSSVNFWLQRTLCVWSHRVLDFVLVWSKMGCRASKPVQRRSPFGTLPRDTTPRGARTTPRSRPRLYRTLLPRTA